MSGIFCQPSFFSPIPSRCCFRCGCACAVDWINAFVYRSRCITAETQRIPAHSVIVMQDKREKALPTRTAVIGSDGANSCPRPSTRSASSLSHSQLIIPAMAFPGPLTSVHVKDGEARVSSGKGFRRSGAIPPHARVSNCCYRLLSHHRLNVLSSCSQVYWNTG